MENEHEKIVERKFDINNNYILLEIHKPYFDNEWKCSQSITFPGGIKKDRTVSGEDSLEALLLSIKIAENFLNSISKEEGWDILWLGESDLGLTINFDEY